MNKKGPDPTWYCSDTENETLIRSLARAFRLPLAFPSPPSSPPLKDRATPLPSCRLLHRLVSERLDVSLDVDVSLFETNIRLLGGLLSAHLLATDPALGLYPDPALSRGDANDGAGSSEQVVANAVEDSGAAGLGRRDSGGDGDGYGGELLALAEDLGRRLLPAFETETGKDLSEYLQL